MALGGAFLNSEDLQPYGELLAMNQEKAWYRCGELGERLRQFLLQRRVRSLWRSLMCFGCPDKRAPLLAYAAPAPVVMDATRKDGEKPRVDSGFFLKLSSFFIRQGKGILGYVFGSIHIAA